MSDNESHDCPLCMEVFEIDDLHFYPCTCGYQICRFCWHRIRTDGNGLCPACRKTYTEDPAMYRPLSQDEVQKVKKERKQKEAQYKQKISDNRQHLSNIRVIQKHLVFVVGLSKKMADIEMLKRPEYFGKYGKIVKIVINPNTNYAGPQGPSASAYITYTREEDALKAIQAINEMQPPLKIRASLGTTKYCTHYLRNMQCPKGDCMYLHDIGDSAASFTKEDMQAGKHQLFEKNLLDNYVAKQQKIIGSQESYEEYEVSEDLDGHSQEDWGEGSENADSSIPSNASWGTNKDEKHIDNYMSEPSPSEYPILEPRKPSPKPLVQEPVSSSMESSRPVKVPSSRPVGVPNSRPVVVPNSRPIVVPNCRPVVVPVQATKTAISPLDTVSNSNVSKEHIIKSEFSTGWATSYETPPAGIPVLQDNLNNNANNFSWPTTCDLGLSDLKIGPSDDDLGFDPFKESKTGLEDLMASENKPSVETAPASTSAPPSFSWDAFWPTNYGSSQNLMSMNSYSLFGASQPMANPHIPPYRPSLNQYPPSQMPSSNPMQPIPPNSSPFRFNTPLQAQQQRFPVQMPNSPQNQKQMPPFMNQYRFPQSPSQGPPGHIQMPSAAGPTSTDNKNWQDGLRALLPNINISFSDQQLEKKLSEKWSSADTPQPQKPQKTEVDKNTKNTITSPPPPGFKVLNGISVEAKPPRIVTTENKKKGALPPPPGFGKPSDPPPGFGKPSEAFPSHPSHPSHPSSLVKASLAVQTTSTCNTLSSTNSSTVTTTTQATHDDPSILWSKVLSDVPKEIERTEMAFPLPGANVSSSASSETSPPSAPSNSNPLTSWNTIVSGNQSPKDPPKVEDDVTSPKSPPLNVPAKESIEPAPQKPTPIFGNQQKHANKQKPTATVKPLKCSAPLDGFTTVQNSRQINAPVCISTAQTGSRVSQLDDFSTEIPPGNFPSVINSLSDYPLVTTTPTKSSKKKKRKGKEPVEQISEVIVGRVETERPAVTVLEDERPKKSGKSKKKNGMKISPPSQRKSPPAVQKSKEQTQPIRILKSDGNAGTTMFSPAQAAADSTSASKTVSSSNHDHEIVSRLTESTEKLLKNVLHETEAIKLNTEQISKDLKSALEKCKESSLSLSDLEKINLLLTPGKLPLGDLDDPDMVDTYDLERQVESARREAKMLEARLNDVIRKNMASEMETLKRNTKNAPQ